MEAASVALPDLALTAYAEREQILQRRVSEAAMALEGQGINPTVARIRAALGGGSPNELTPALKRWRSGAQFGIEGSASARPNAETQANIPPVIADLAKELWQRALSAASTELRGGPTARQVVARTEEAVGLREQVKTLRDQLERDQRAYGELRAQGARNEAMARAALTRGAESETRERALLQELGVAMQRIAFIEASVSACSEIRGTVTPTPRATKRRRSTVKKKARSRFAKPKRRAGPMLLATRRAKAKKRGVRRS